MIFDILSIYIANIPLLRERAYLDPSSGSFLIQLLIAGLVGVAFAIKMSWKKIKSLFNRSAGESETENPDDTEQEG
jgi:hypothetical protein